MYNLPNVLGEFIFSTALALYMVKFLKINEDSDTKPFTMYTCLQLFRKNMIRFWIKNNVFIHNIIQISHVYVKEE